MCTISFVPVKNKFIFTFNRDELTMRQTPEYLSCLDIGFKQIYYAKDIKVGGTWFAADDRGNIALLFNGAINKHIKQPAYEKSRGLVLLELISSYLLMDYFININLDNIEPFSIILFEEKKLFRLLWDGREKQVFPLDPKRHYIFSSATLYNFEVQLLRESWLNSYLNELLEMDEENLHEFHSSYKIEDKENGLLIERKNSTRTLSISQAIIHENEIMLKHWDIITDRYYQQMIMCH